MAKQIKVTKQSIKTIISASLGGVAAFLLAYKLSADGYLLTFLIGICLAIFLLIFIHESGHLVFGLLSGYRFTSFRIGSFMWVKQDGKIRFKRYSVAGTGGQCLMSPPDMIDGKMPFTLFNLGGSIFNFLTGLLFIIAYLHFKDVPHLSLFLLVNSLFQFYGAIINGIPMRLSMMDNDGQNVISFRKNSGALRSLWVQLKISEELTRGLRLREMPEEWFELPPDEKPENAMVASIGVFAANRMMDLHDFNGAEALIKRLLQLDSLAGLHRNLLICDLIYCRLIAGDGKEEIDSLYGKIEKTFMTSMKNFPTVIRTEYVYAMFAQNDLRAADKFKKHFEKCAVSYPYQSDIESEREFMMIAEQVYACRNSAEA